MKKLIIVESPAKIKTISKFLSKDFKIMSTMGHIKDLPPKKIGVSVSNGIDIEYVVIEGKDTTIANICKQAAGADIIYLAPDPDREGEIIAWHIGKEIEKVAKKNAAIYRIAFNEITKPAILGAIGNPGVIDSQRVSAQQARRVLDRWVGYEVSPILWKKITSGLSAGRVQSVALRMICDREQAIRAFKPEEYWSIAGLFKHNKAKFIAPLTHINKKKIDIKNKKSADKTVTDLKKLIVGLLFLFFSTKMVFCSEGLSLEQFRTIESEKRSESSKKRKAEKRLDGENGYKKGRFEGLSLLVGQGKKDERLWQAITGQRLDLGAVKSILAAQANPNARGESNETLLYHLASDSYGSFFCNNNNNVSYNQQHHAERLNFASQVMQILLQNNADPNVQSKGGYTALYAAADDRYVQSKGGYTALYAAADDRYVRGFGNGPHYDGEFNLKYLNMNLNRMKKLLEHNADPNLQDGGDDQTVLHHVLVDNCGQLFLGVPGFDPRFHKKYLDCKKTIVQALLAKNADTNVKDAHNNTPLHLASLVGHCPTVMELLKCRANPEINNQYGDKPIHIAAGDLRNFPVVPLLLLQYDADLSAKTPAGDTVTSLMQNPSAVSVIQWIRGAGIVEKPLFLSCLLPNLSLVTAMIQKEVDVNQRDKKGMTSLMYAVYPFSELSGMEEDRPSLVRLLLDANADPAIVEDNGFIALDLATDDEIKKIIRNFNLDEGRKRSLEELIKVLLGEQEVKKACENGLFKLILEFAGTWERIK